MSTARAFFGNQRNGSRQPRNARPRNAGGDRDRDRDRSNRPAYHSTPTTRNARERECRGYQPGMVLQDALPLLEDSDSDEGGVEAGYLHSTPPFNMESPRPHMEPPRPHSGFYTPSNLATSTLQPCILATPPAPSEIPTHVTIMLQQQQGMLNQIIRKQEEIQKKQAEFQDKLTELESKVPSPNSSNCSTDTGKRKRVVSKDLSVSDNNNVLLLIYIRAIIILLF